MNISKEMATQAATAIPTLQSTLMALETLFSGLPTEFNEAEQKVIKAAEGTIRGHYMKSNKIISDCKSRGKQLKPLIDQAILGVHRITSELEVFRCRKKALLEAREITIARLQNMGFDAAKIEKIEPYPKAELNGYDVQIEALTAEHAAVDAFIKSSPAWDVSLLRGTRFEQESKQFKAA